MDGDGWDGLKLCETCGDAYTTGRLCVSCAFQKMIDNAEGGENGGDIDYDVDWYTEQEGEISEDHNSDEPELE